MIDLNFCADTIRMLLLGLVLAASTGEVMVTLGQAPSVLTASSTSTLAAGARMLAATPTVRFGQPYVGSRCKTETRLVVGPPFAQSSPAMFAIEQALPQLEPQTVIWCVYPYHQVNSSRICAPTSVS